MSEALHLSAFLLCTLCLVIAFASWVLASINIRRTIAFRSDYAKIDPAMVVYGVLASTWFLGVVTIGHRAIFRAKNVVAVTGACIVWVFALGVSYCARRWKGPNNCPNSGVFPEGCRGRWKALIAFCWVGLILMSMYVGLVFALVRKHEATQTETSRKSGWEVPVDDLCHHEKHEGQEKEGHA